MGNHSNQRLELLFLDHCYAWLKTAGVLIFVIPDNALSHCAKRLASQFERISVFRLAHPESVRFRQLAVVAIRKKEHHRGDTRYADQLLRLAYNSDRLPTLSSETTERYIVPESVAVPSSIGVCRWMRSKMQSAVPAPCRMHSTYWYASRNASRGVR